MNYASLLLTNRHFMWIYCNVTTTTINDGYFMIFLQFIDYQGNVLLLFKKPFLRTMTMNNSKKLDIQHLCCVDERHYADDFMTEIAFFKTYFETHAKLAELHFLYSISTDGVRAKHFNGMD